MTPESLSPFESVRLFVERSLASKTDFTVTNENAPALASICYRLDGIPLAIELAAARVRSLPIEQIEQRLDQRFRLLTGGSRTALPRQQTLRSLIDWSYDLLTEVEKALLCRLSVFAGGWTLESAEQVCSGDLVEDWEVLDLLTSLTDKSLVVYLEATGVARYRLLETVRQYARDRLLESGEVEVWRERHLAHFLALAQEAKRGYYSAQQGKWLDSLETEHDNLNMALTWCSQGSGDSTSGLQLAGELWPFWNIRSYWYEGHAWLSQLLSHKPDEQDPGVRSEALLGLGTLSRHQGDYITTQKLFTESLAMCRQTGNLRGTAAVLNNLGTLALDQGKNMESHAFLEESLAIFRELGGGAEMANVLLNLGNVAVTRNDFVSAHHLTEESLTLYRQVGSLLGIANGINNLGNLAEKQGEYLRAQALYQQSLVIYADLGSRGSVVISFDGLAVTAIGMTKPIVAARLMGAAQRLREEIGSPVPPREQVEFDQQLTTARALLAADAAFDAAWQEGRAMTMEQAIDLALAPT